MENYKEFSAKTKNDAITKASLELGTSSDQLDIVVVSEGSSGFFGIGSKPAVIKARKKAAVSADEDFDQIVKSVSMDSLKEEEKVSKEKKQKAEKTVKAAPKKEEKPREEKPVEKKAEKQESAAEKPVKKESSAPKSEKKADRPAKPAKKQENKQAQKPRSEAKPERPVEILTDENEIKEIEQRAVVFLKDVFASMNLGEVEIKSVYNKNDGSLDVDFEGEDMGVLIGKRGQTLDSLQYLTSLVVNKGKDKYVRVKLDTEDYRRRRKETLENLAKGIAYKVKKTRKAVTLEPMNPYERRIIHAALQGNKFVETFSEGEEPYRHVVVRLKK